MPDPPFIPAAELAGAFYSEVVQPLIGGDPHSAALLGWGSDVLGYDTARSTDHGWGPRLLVFVDDPRTVGAVQQQVDAGLPERFRGWPVRFGWDAVPVQSHVTVTTLPGWLVEHLGFDATAGVATLDWLLTPQQRLLGVVAGAVHADDSGRLARLRRDLSWYPDPVWRWLLACQWHRLAQEEAFVARTAEVGDHTGSAVTAARLVRDMMRLALLLARRYAPYQKWLGTAFAGLNAPDDGLAQHLAGALRAPDLATRAAALGAAYSVLAARHNATGLTPALDTGTGHFYSRPARVLMADRFADACRATITEPALRDLPLIGGIDQIVDCTDILATPQLYRRLAVVYAPAFDGSARRVGEAPGFHPRGDH